MSQEIAPQTTPSWISKLDAFFLLPNPRILHLFIISSSATFSLGIAMIVEWIAHGRHHPGYHWIVYYAPSMIALPVFVWIICIISGIFFFSNDQNLQAEVEEEVQPKQVLALQDQQAVVQIQPVHDDHPSSFTEESVIQGSNAIDDKSIFKRTFSLPLSQISVDYSNITRTMSFR